MSKDDKVKAYLAYACVSFFWGTTYLAIRIGVEEMPPALFAGIRFLLAGLLFVGILLLRGYKLPPKQDLGVIAVVGISLLTIANGIVVWAEQFIPSSLAALIVTTLPLWMVAIEALLPRGDKLNWRKATGILIGFAGVLILLWPDLSGSLDPAYLTGVIVILFAPIFWSAGSIYAKYRKTETPPLMSAAVQMVIAGAVLTTIGLAVGEASRFEFTTRGVSALVYLTIFGSIVGYGSFIYALDKLPATVVSTYAYLNPVVAVVLGWLILDERLDWPMVIATAIILSGVVLVKTNRPGRRVKEMRPQAEVERNPKSCARPVTPNEA